MIITDFTLVIDKSPVALALNPSRRLFILNVNIILNLGTLESISINKMLHQIPKLIKKCYHFNKKMPTHQIKNKNTGINMFESW